MPDKNIAVTKSSLSTGYQRPTSLSQAYSNRRYHGKIVIETPEGIYSTASEQQAVKYIHKMEKKYPNSPPTSTIISKEMFIPVPVKPKSPAPK